METSSLMSGAGRPLLLRSKSLPATDPTARLTVDRNDSVLSSQSSASAATTTCTARLDSGLGGGDEPSSPAKVNGGAPDGSGKEAVGCAAIGSVGGGIASKENGGLCGAQVAVSLSLNPPKTATIRLHYYPEGGWGWVVCACAALVEVATHGLHSGFGIFYVEVLRRYGEERTLQAGCLGALSMCVSLLVAPLVVAACKRRSTRLAAVLGGLVAALGLLFSSFSSQFHQLFFSHGLVLGTGIGLCRTTASLMLGQYFKRRRELVEAVVQAAAGLGLLASSAFTDYALGTLGWRLGLQAMTGAVFVTFFLGIFYRSASLYHPQRRAILHLKNQKRKIKDKGRAAAVAAAAAAAAHVQDHTNPARRMASVIDFFDLTAVRSRTVQILLLSAAVSALGIHSPLVYLAHEARRQGVSSGGVLGLQAYVGAGAAVGAAAFGVVVVRNSADCRIARHYLCLAAGAMLGASLLALAGAVDEYHGLALFACVYGPFLGGYHYALKMFAYEKVRARNFARTWGLVQAAQALPTAVGIPITGYINQRYGNKSGFYFASACAVAGSATLLLVDLHRRRTGARHHRGSTVGGAGSTAAGDRLGQRRFSPAGTAPGAGPRRARSSGSLHLLSGAGTGSGVGGEGGRANGCGVDREAALAARRRLSQLHAELKRAELTCISEEGCGGDHLLDPDQLLDADLQLDELDFLADCMTSCDQVEHYLMLSEYENNLNKISDDMRDVGLRDVTERRRRRSVTAATGVRAGTGEDDDAGTVPESCRIAALPRLPSRGPGRGITVIDEITTTL